MHDAVEVLIEQLPDAQDLPLPAYATAGSAGMDLMAAVPQDFTLMPGERALIPTGIRIAVPEGYEAQIRPRSGLALRYGLALVNSPGTIDSDYRGELKIIIMNLGGADFVVHRGDRIAQLVISKIYHADIIETDELSQTERGEGGFHSTGRN